MILGDFSRRRRQIFWLMVPMDSRHGRLSSRSAKPCCFATSSFLFDLCPAPFPSAARAERDGSTAGILALILLWIESDRLYSQITTLPTDSQQRIDNHQTANLFDTVSCSFRLLYPLYTVSQKKTCKVIFVGTSSNIHQLWKCKLKLC